MKFRIPPLASDIIISIYAVITLYLRFKFEQNAIVSPMNSIVMGVCFVLIIWVFIKLKILNPNWFGLIKSKKAKS
ncbi:hypothetical protein [Algibacter sp.]|uniref:hypothetical protein n=1 Tax=Algibacter sp. TaxID=1872428 RepID=UPI003C738E3E